MSFIRSSTAAWWLQVIQSGQSTTYVHVGLYGNCDVLERGLLAAPAGLAMQFHGTELGSIHRTVSLCANLSLPCCRPIRPFHHLRHGASLVVAVDSDAWRPSPVLRSYERRLSYNLQRTRAIHFYRATSSISIELEHTTTPPSRRIVSGRFVLSLFS